MTTDTTTATSVLVCLFELLVFLVCMLEAALVIDGRGKIKVELRIDEVVVNVEEENKVGKELESILQ